MRCFGQEWKHCPSLYFAHCSTCSASADALNSALVTACLCSLMWCAVEPRTPLKSGHLRISTSDLGSVNGECMDAYKGTHCDIQSELYNILTVWNSEQCADMHAQCLVLYCPFHVDILPSSCEGVWGYIWLAVQAHTDGHRCLTNEACVCTPLLLTAHTRFIDPTLLQPQCSEEQKLFSFLGLCAN